MKVGEILVLESGEYSDKSWHGPFRVLKDFKLREAAEQMRSEFKPTCDSEVPDPWGLIGWLTQHGYIEDIEHLSAHIGSYGQLEIDSEPGEEG